MRLMADLGSYPGGGVPTPLHATLTADFNSAKCQAGRRRREAGRKPSTTPANVAITRYWPPRSQTKCCRNEYGAAPLGKSRDAGSFVASQSAGSMRWRGREADLPGPTSTKPSSLSNHRAAPVGGVHRRNRGFGVGRQRAARGVVRTGGQNAYGGRVWRSRRQEAAEQVATEGVRPGASGRAYGCGRGR